VASSREALREGPAVVRGRVDGDAPVVATLVQSRGERVFLHRWHTVWREDVRGLRTVTSAPFRLTLPDAATLQVEPGARVELETRYVTAPVGADGSDRVGPRDRRRRTLTLARGDEVHVAGVLVRVLDARGSAGGAHLAPPHRLGAGVRSGADSAWASTRRRSSRGASYRASSRAASRALP